jgi:hypothetical protein
MAQVGSLSRTINEPNTQLTNVSITAIPMKIFKYLARIVYSFLAYTLALHFSDQAG